MRSQSWSNELTYNANTGVFSRFWFKAKISKDTGWLNKKNGYVYVSCERKLVLAHRLAWKMFHGTEPDAHIDHINGVKTDNRIENLRISNKSLNGANRGPNKGRQLPKGVYLHGKKHYRAKIHCMGKDYFLGSHKTVDQAKAAYDAKAAELFGEFARAA